jgi:hypothetical protein
MANQPTAPPSAGERINDTLLGGAKPVRAVGCTSDGRSSGRLTDRTDRDPYNALLRRPRRRDRRLGRQGIPGRPSRPGPDRSVHGDGATAALTACFKFLSGWQQHEQNVADGRSPAIREPATTKPPFALLRRVKPEN